MSLHAKCLGIAGSASPPPRLPTCMVAEKAVGTSPAPCSPRAGFSLLAVEQGLSREDVGSGSALDSGRVASPDSVQREPSCGVMSKSFALFVTQFPQV